jgi:sigma-B regulation protein RsbU (phosphoserine phosphatase)
LTGIVKASFHASSGSGHDPSDVVHRIAAGLRPFQPDRFVTALCLRLSREGLVEYVNAGHPPGLLFGSDAEPRELVPTGPLISSALPLAQWAAKTVEMLPNDRLLLFTDGVPDAEARSDSFGMERLTAAMRETSAPGGRAEPAAGERVLEGIVAGVRGFLSGRPLGDDLTLVTVARAHREEETARGVRPAPSTGTKS